MIHAFYKTKQIDEATHEKLTNEVLIISKSIKNFLKYLTSNVQNAKKISYKD